MSSGVTISGAVSGLDTAGIINQLVSIESNHQTILRTQQSAVQKRADAYASLVASLTTFGSLASDLATTSTWNGTVASSSSSGVTATSTGTTAGSITFNVTSVAAAHAVVSTSAVASTGDVVAPTGSITFTRGGTDTAISVGTGSLAEVVSAINSSGQGLVATAVKTGTDEYRLQVTSSTTGAASQFSLAGLTGFAGMVDLTLGTDATIHVGTVAANAYDISSPTNTFADLIPGASFTVSRLENDVTVSTKVDGSAVADKVAKLVDQANTILSDIRAKTAYDVKTRTGGAFTGESGVRQLQQNILSTVSGQTTPGVNLTRDGKITFDRTAFLTAFTADPAKVAAAFGSSSSYAANTGAETSSVTMTNALKTTREGTYDIVVDTLAKQEKWQLDPPDPVLTGTTFALARGTTTASYTSLVGDDLTAVMNALNTQSAQAGLGIVATVSGTSLVFTASSAGSAHAFTATLDAVAGTMVTQGTDIVGSIDYQAGEGVGDVLSLPTGTGGAVGLSLAVTASDAALAATGGAIGSFTYTPGLAQRFATVVQEATAAGTGTVISAQTGANDSVKRFQAQIDAWDDRITAYRQRLTTQFTAMETALQRLKSSMSSITNMVNALSASSSSSSSSS